MKTAPVFVAPSILLIGTDGQIGWELRRTLATLGDVVPCARRELDLSQPEEIRRVIRRVKPKLIINAAAFTNVDAAEREPDLAMMVNGTAPGVIAEEARRLRAAVIHYSSDFIFDGKTFRPYREEDHPNPINLYGDSKLAGEQALQESGVAHLILRTGWVYGCRGRNFLLTILRLAAKREVLRVVDDQVGAPTWSRVLAEATAQIIARGAGDFPGYLSENGGIYHLSCGGEVSWYAFARRILELASPGTFEQVDLEPIKSSEFPSAASRPAYSVLDNSKLRRKFNICPPLWEVALSLALSADAAECKFPVS